MENEETKKIKEIWSEKYWKKEAIRIEMCYWKLIKDKIPNVKSPHGKKKIEHKIEQFVRDLSRKTNIGNLHFGLTSSDLEDNIRAKRIKESLNIIQDLLMDFYDVLFEGEDKKNCLVAYTHLLSAGITNLDKRFNPQYEAFIKYRMPEAVFKGIGGAIGDKYMQNKLEINKDDLDGIFLGNTIQLHTTQTVNHLFEFQASCWLTFQASLICKIANDFRMMFALEQAKMKGKEVGSTALPHKRPNPWQFERVSGRCLILFESPSRIAKIAADCLLERTLTNQSVLDYSFKEAFGVFVDIILTMIKVIQKVEIINQTAKCRKRKYHSQEDFFYLVMSGDSREMAQKKIYEKNNKKR